MLLKTRAYAIGIELIIGNRETVIGSDLSDCFGVILQYPDTYGEVYSPEHIIQHCQEHQVKVAVGTDLMALALLKPPGEMGADIVYGSSQRFGVPMGFGGPHACRFLP